ncbi:hypothetical protein JAAARDRAFT_142549 [Jaapia argillacea MUCL 33604]|uniref:HTH CENPB-type domain-containing protein n=1 Tax=Jaapia argillacea MUCL 33604 TaxID=933084 RepID=A0A067P5M3_9AGAM|nr:hypothetical protein JAAARDRAFT_142549 [Jaapia argillacea MUCL 33604]
MAFYQEERDRPETEKRRGLRLVCQEFEKEHLKETGEAIKLSHATLARLVKGGVALARFNESKSWLLKEEVEQVIECARAVADRGFPSSHRRLKEHVDEICRARLGSNFPKQGVARGWTQRFVTKHSDRLTMYKPRPLDKSRARGVNPTANAAWFTLLAETLEKGDDGKPIAQECCWAADESGFQSGLGETQEKVIGGKGKKSQYQQHEGDRENITAIVTIGADGSSLPPAVIFKGQAYQSSWKQDNPANAS